MCGSTAIHSLYVNTQGVPYVWAAARDDAPPLRADQRVLAKRRVAITDGWPSQVSTLR